MYAKSTTMILLSLFELLAYLLFCYGFLRSQEENILLVSLLMAETGVHSVAYAFPKVKIITTAVDGKLDENFHIIPGLGKRLVQ